MRPDKSMRERGLDGNQVKEVFLRVAAYRALHDGRNPPMNSLLWRENLRVWRQNHPSSSILRWLLPVVPETDRWKSGPLKHFLVERSFLCDDHCPESVENRLEAWPMVAGFGPPKRAETGEWFQYAIEVMADDMAQAEQTVDYIFSLDRQD